eukprot:25766-Hanusia_phi.AAC.1
MGGPARPSSSLSTVGQKSVRLPWHDRETVSGTDGRMPYSGPGRALIDSGPGGGSPQPHRGGWTVTVRDSGR